MYSYSQPVSRDWAQPYTVLVRSAIYGSIATPYCMHGIHIRLNRADSQLAGEAGLSIDVRTTSLGTRREKREDGEEGEEEKKYEIEAYKFMIQYGRAVSADLLACMRDREKARI